MAGKAAEFLRSYRKLLSVEILAIGVIAALVGTFAGPFGTYDAMDVGQRAVYWSLITVISILLGRTAFALVEAAGIAPGSLGESLIGAALTAGFVTGGVWAVTLLYGQRVFAMPKLYFLFINVLVITVGVVFLRQMFLRFARRSAVPDAPAETAPEVAEVPAPAQAGPLLLRRLPEGAGETILHLSVCDHHVDIHTETGTTSLRMRLADAIEAMEGVPGFRVHRSHWVARAAIDGVEREQGRLFLRLTSGALVPVSRGARPILEEAGIL